MIFDGALIILDSQHCPFILKWHFFLRYKVCVTVFRWAGNFVGETGQFCKLYMI